MTQILAAFDILPMSGKSGDTQIRVALAVKTKSGKIRTWEGVDRRKFFSLMHNFKPELIGTDNPYEILESGEDYTSFYNRLPPVSSLVHVNADHRGNMVNLGSLMRKHKVKGWDKKSPLKTALSMIKLLEIGEGVAIEPFESETIIKVGQPKRHKKGGWSQARYARQNEEVVAFITNTIKEILQKNSIEFDLVSVETKFGAKSSRFHTFEDRLKIAQLFTNVRLRPAHVKFISPPRPTVKKRYLKKENHPKVMTTRSYQRRILVGIDPGTTVGIAILDLNGKPLEVLSQRQISKGEIIQAITEYGIPVVFCSDVSPIPQLVSKLAATFESEILSPNTLLSKLDKRELAKEVNFRVNNNHESDALAAAVNGYKQIRSRFNNLNTEGLKRIEIDLSKALVLKGLNSVDARTAVLNMRRKPERKVLEREPEGPSQQLLNRVDNLLKFMAESEFTVANLRAHLSKLESDIERERIQKDRLIRELKKSRDRNIRDALAKELVANKSRELSSIRKELSMSNVQNKKLEKKVKSLQEALWIGLQEGAYPLKVLDVFSGSGIDEIYAQRVSEGDLILVLDGSGGGPRTALKLVERRPRIIFVRDKMFTPEALEVFHDFKIPVMDADGYNIRVLESVAIIHPLDFEKAIHDYEILLRNQTRIKNIDGIIGALSNYKFERRSIMEAPDYDDYEFEEEDEI